MSVFHMYVRFGLKKLPKTDLFMIYYLDLGVINGRMVEKELSYPTEDLHKQFRYYKECSSKLHPSSRDVARCLNFETRIEQYPLARRYKKNKKHVIFAGKPLSKACKNNYEKSKKFLNEILQAENDYSKWFSLICKVPDKEFVFNNIEHRLGTELSNKGLWHLYIEYLKEIKDIKVM